MRMFWTENTNFKADFDKKIFFHIQNGAFAEPIKADPEEELQQQNAIFESLVERSNNGNV